MKGSEKAEQKKMINQTMSDSHAFKQMINTAQPTRQASVKAPANRKGPLLYNNVYGVSDSGDIRLTVNASKNLFGNGSQKLQVSEPFSAYLAPGNKSMIPFNKGTSDEKINSDLLTHLQGMQYMKTGAKSS